MGHKSVCKQVSSGLLFSFKPIRKCRTLSHQLRYILFPVCRHGAWLPIFETCSRKADIKSSA